MGAGEKMIVSLSEAAHCDEALIGGKALKLGRLIAAGYRVPPGFCIPVAAYERFIDTAKLTRTIRVELGRKPLSSMRWEEIWDAALRIRSAFLAADIPASLTEAIGAAYEHLGASTVAVRSSAPGEDSAERSHAGLHESVIGITDRRACLDAVRIVWASLWSDAALLYRQELNMDPAKSRMAVIVQAFIAAVPSGVGFGIDPRDPAKDVQIVEAVPGPCEDLVSGTVDPDRWIMKRSTGDIVEWRARQSSGARPKPLLDRPDLSQLHKTLRSVEDLFGWPPDIEWAGKKPDLTLLQARPVTGPAAQSDDNREWYLSLRPGKTQLQALCTRVSNELIPALEMEALQLAKESLSDLSDAELAQAIEKRVSAFRKWEKIYRNEFIPFAHGVRQLGLYYNDAVRPEDPYEFVGILRSQRMVATERNEALQRLAGMIRELPGVRQSIEQLAAGPNAGDRNRWPEPANKDVAAFYDAFDAFLKHYMNITYQGEALDNHPDLALGIILKLAAAKPAAATAIQNSEKLEQRLLDAIGSERRDEALDVIRIGRLSWKLRDDDNILMGQLEHQLHRALGTGVLRLQSQGRLPAESSVPHDHAEIVIAALRDPSSGVVHLPRNQEVSILEQYHPDDRTPRQLIGQPAAPGIATGLARIIGHTSDIRRFERGEILVCDAIQPTMTHLVPIAGGIVERRGGMLIHGAIIARELGVPCVNGVANAADLLHNGDLLTVDGHLGIVTVGPPEFNMELENILRSENDNN